MNIKEFLEELKEGKKPRVRYNVIVNGEWIASYDDEDKAWDVAIGYQNDDSGYYGMYPNAYVETEYLDDYDEISAEAAYNDDLINDFETRHPWNDDFDENGVDESLKEDLYNFSKADKKAIIQWWKDVQEAMGETYVDLSTLDNANEDDDNFFNWFSAMYDVLNDLRYNTIIKDDDKRAKVTDLYKKGKRLYNKYALSQFNENLKEDKDLTTDWFVKNDIDNVFYNHKGDRIFESDFELNGRWVFVPHINPSKRKVFKTLDDAMKYANGLYENLNEGTNVDDLKNQIKKVDKQIQDLINNVKRIDNDKSYNTMIDHRNGKPIGDEVKSLNLQQNKKQIDALKTKKKDLEDDLNALLDRIGVEQDKEAQILKNRKKEQDYRKYYGENLKEDNSLTNKLNTLLPNELEEDLDTTQNLIDSAKKFAKDSNIDVKVMGIVNSDEVSISTFPEDFNEMVELFNTQFDVYDEDEELEKFKIKYKEIV